MSADPRTLLSVDETIATLRREATNVVWIRIRSWHAVRWTRKTLCGRVPEFGAEVSETLPAGRSCESCLRIVARKVDA